MGERGQKAKATEDGSYCNKDSCSIRSMDNESIVSKGRQSVQAVMMWVSRGGHVV